MRKFIYQTVRAIHRVFLASYSLNDAATILRVSTDTLINNLSKIHYINEHNQLLPLTFHAMKNLWPDEQIAEMVWGAEYDQLIHDVVVDLNQITMRELHQIFLCSRSHADAARKLRIYNLTLGAHLGKTSYITETGQQEPLTFEIMKTQWPTEESAFAFWGDDYDQPMNTTAVSLDQKTMRAIHRVFLSSNSVAAAAGKLGVNVSTLNVHLAKTNYFNQEIQEEPLTFDIMKTQWPTEESAFAYWGDDYDQPMNTTAVGLDQKTMRAIHRVFLSSNSAASAAGKLGVDFSSLKIHLGKTNYINEEGQPVPLTFKIMKNKWPTEESAFAFWGDAYHQPMNTTAVDLKQKTMRMIHRIILSSNSLSDASGKMGVSYKALNIHLAKTNYINEEDQLAPLTFQIMKNQWPTEEIAFAYWRDIYDQPMNTSVVNLKQKTMRMIHKIILSSNSLSDAAGALGLNHDTLNMHLSRASYHDEEGQPIRLTFQMMKNQWPTEEIAFAYWGEVYNQPMNTTPVDLKQQTMRALHRMILTSNSIADTAGKLGVNQNTLNIHLGRANYYNEERQHIPLTFQLMKTQWPTEQSAFAYWGDAYDKPINIVVAGLKQKTMLAIHRIILSSESLADAAGKLGVRHKPLSVHLSKINYHNEEGQQVPLTFQIMKNKWPTEESAFAYWGDAYHRPINATTVDLNQKTMRAIHQIILSSNSLADASGKMGVSDKALSIHLAKTNYINKENQQVPLTFQIMKTEWPTEQHAFECWRDAYDQPMITTAVDLNQKTMRTIHRIILSSNSLSDAAGALGISHNTLNMHLSRASYHDAEDQPTCLSFQMMKNQWPTEEIAFAYWGDAYDKPINTTPVDLKQKTMRAIHRVFLSSNSLCAAAGKLGISQNTLNMHLSRALYYNEEEQHIPLTFQLMKTQWPTEQSAFAYWRDAYDKPINTLAVDLKQQTMRAIHRIILSSDSLATAAGKLGVNYKTLSMHLGKTNYINEEDQQIPLTFQIIKTLWPTEQHAFAYWRDAYDQRMNTEAVDLNQKTMRAIHQVILSSKSLSDAAEKLAVSYKTLCMHLSKKSYINKENQQVPLTFKIMKTQWPTEENAFEYWGDTYNQPMNIEVVGLKQKTIRAIHRIIISSKSLSDAAEKLGLNDTALKKHLSKTNYINAEDQHIPLTFEILKFKWPTEESAFAYWGDAYDESMKPTACRLKQKTMHVIHRIILSSKSHYDAAEKLGISYKALDIHLSKTNYTNEHSQQVPLTFQIMKTVWPTEESAFKYWDNAYYQPMNTAAVDLKQKTMHAIHRIILSSHTVTEAARKLGVYEPTLIKHLGKTNCITKTGLQEPLTFEIMKTQWPTEENAFAYWSDAYYQPIVSSNKRSASKKRKNCGEAPVKKSKLRFFELEVPENESEKTYNDLMSFGTP